MGESSEIERALFSQLGSQPRFYLFAQEFEGAHDLLMRNEAAAIEFGQDAVEADLLLQLAQLLADALGCADQHIAAQHIGIGQRAQAFGAVDKGLPAGAPRRPIAGNVSGVLAAMRIGGVGFWYGFGTTATSLKL